MNSKNPMEKILLIITTITIILSPYKNQPLKLVGAYPSFTRFHITFMNTMSHGETLDLHCKGNKGDWGLQHLPINVNYTRNFKTVPLMKVYYNCDANWTLGHITNFQAFIDNQKFADIECGGRHCIWKATDLGMYLYQLHDQTFVFKHGWEPNA
ncbi:hypothetical protein RND81_05G220400 [Saponaria officinalis]|uniref:S-protein homolog n=1 Tax=Saponaria officinalis TaxID=3572 RepID=A0AAW1KV72_SAPOF